MSAVNHALPTLRLNLPQPMTMPLRSGAARRLTAAPSVSSRHPATLRTTAPSKQRHSTPCSATTPKPDLSKWHRHMLDVLEGYLTELPPLFRAHRNGLPIRPFAIGLDVELRALKRPEISRRKLAAWLYGWTNSKSYLEALTAPDAWRVALDLRRVEPVSLENIVGALERLAVE